MSSDPAGFGSLDPGKSTASLDEQTNVYEGGVKLGTQARQLDFDASAFNITEDTINDQADIALNFGSSAGTVCQGNDPRLSDARTPLAHTHSAADITSGVFDIARIPTGTSSTTVCIGNDSRLSDKRAPTISGETTNDIMYFNGTNWVRLASATGFLKGGGVPAYSAISAGDLPSHTHVKADITDFAHTHPKTEVDDTGTWNVAEIPTLTRAKISDFLPIVTSDISDDNVTFDKVQNISTARILGRITASTGNIEELTAAQAKTVLAIVKADISDFAHNTTHQSGGGDAIKLDDLAAPDDNTDLNASVSAHGLLRKLDGLTTTFLRGDGTWAVPPGGGGGANISQTEIDFGNTPIKFKEFVVTDAAVSTSNQIIATVAYETTTGEPGGYTDQAEELTEEVSLSCKPGTGNFTIYAVSHHKVLHGKLKINYLVG